MNTILCRSSLIKLMKIIPVRKGSPSSALPDNFSEIETVEHQKRRPQSNLTSKHHISHRDIVDIKCHINLTSIALVRKFEQGIFHSLSFANFKSIAISILTFVGFQKSKQALSSNQWSNPTSPAH